MGARAAAGGATSRSLGILRSCHGCSTCGLLSTAARRLPAQCVARPAHDVCCDGREHHAEGPLVCSYGVCEWTRRQPRGRGRARGGRMRSVDASRQGQPAPRVPRKMERVAQRGGVASIQSALDVEHCAPVSASHNQARAVSRATRAARSRADRRLRRAVWRRAHRCTAAGMASRANC